jgi:N-acyl-phosphatidylethanolamine-hydrolysing phospholipase D
MKSPFDNPWPHKTHGFSDILGWKLGISAREKPRIPDAPNSGAPLITLDPLQIAQAPIQTWRTTWLGHASFLVQGGGISLLIDPVFSDHCAPLPFPSLKRKVAPPCLLSELPHIDAILLTHTHYDHLDLPTLRQLGQTIPLFLPSGHKALLKKSGFNNVTELAWWDSHDLTDNIRITAVPGQHFTSRTPFDRNTGHWCGWVIEGVEKKLWHAGDSGYCPVFSDIGERFDGIDLAMIPIGAYQPRSIMQAMHMNPDEAVQAFIDAKCQRAIAMHWGTFQLTDEPFGEPPILLKQAMDEKNLPDHRFVAGSIGEIWYVS